MARTQVTPITPPGAKSSSLLNEVGSEARETTMRAIHVVALVVLIVLVVAADFSLLQVING